MHRRIWLSVCILSLLTCTSCFPESKNPLSPVADAELDAGLVGLWTRDDADDVQYLHIGGEAEKPLTAGADKPESGLMRFLFTGHGKDAGRPVLHASFGARFYVTKLGNERFINLVQPIEEGRSSGPAGFYSFLKYKIERDQLTVWFANMQAAAKAIEAGELSGTVTREGENVKNVQLTDSSERLATYFQTEAGKKLFPDDGGKLAFRKLR
jgi:hypothetical protein